MKILILCNGGNSCRGLMAKSFLQQADQSLEIYPAEIYPENQVDMMAIQVMDEIGIDISPKSPKIYSDIETVLFDYLLVLHDSTRNFYLPLNLSYKYQIQIKFNNPQITHSEEKNIEAYREMRDEIKDELHYFYSRILKRELSDEHKRLQPQND